MLIAVRVQRVIGVKYVVNKIIVFISAHDFRWTEFLKCIILNPAFIGPDKNPMQRSDSARPHSRVFEGECKLGVRQSVISTIKLPSKAVTEVKVLETIRMIEFVGSSTKRLVGTPKHHNTWDSLITSLFSSMLE